MNPILYYTYYTPASSSPAEIRKQEHALGRKLLREGLLQIYNITLSDKELEAHIQEEANGKPCLKDFPGIHFNITHCDGLVACAFHDHPIGVDAELPGYFARVLLKKALSEQEQEFLRRFSHSPQLEQEWFFRFWTLKEAYVKKSGIGVDTDLTSVSFFLAELNTEKPRDSSNLWKVYCSDSAVSCWQTIFEQGQVMSVCCDWQDKFQTGEKEQLSWCIFPISLL